MWTRSKDKTNPGKFAFSLYTDTGALVRTVGGFDTHTAAERAAEKAQRELLHTEVAQIESARRYFDTVETNDMTDDELLAALEG